MRWFRRKPKFRHPCRVCRRAGYQHSHPGQSYLPSLHPPASCPPMTSMPPVRTDRLLSARSRTVPRRSPVLPVLRRDLADQLMAALYRQAEEGDPGARERLEAMTVQVEDGGR